MIIGIEELVAAVAVEVLQDIYNLYWGVADRSIPAVFLNEINLLSGYSFPLYEYEKGKEEYNRIQLTFLKNIGKGIQAAIDIPGFVSNLFDNTSAETREIANATGDVEIAVPDPAAQHTAESAEAAQ